MMRLLTVTVLAVLAACADSGAPGPASEERVIRVRAELPATRDIDYVLTALGSVESIHHPTISAETGGQIVTVDVAEGDPVHSAQQLASMDNTLHQIEAEKAQAELNRQSVELENQRKEVARLKRLASSRSVSEDQLEDQEAQLAMSEARLKVAQQQLRRARYMESKTRALAPRAGLVSRRHVSLGDYVSPGTPLFDLVSVDRLRARLSFPERKAADIAIGKAVRLASPTAPGVDAQGQVSSVNPLIRMHSRAIEVMVEFDNPGGWSPGASVDATLIVEQRSGALTLPAASLVERGGRVVVFVVEQGRARARPVTAGWREAGWVEVLEGITDTDRVVVEGATVLTEGSRISEASPAGMAD